MTRIFYLTIPELSGNINEQTLKGLYMGKILDLSDISVQSKRGLSAFEDNSLDLGTKMSSEVIHDPALDTQIDFDFTDQEEPFFQQDSCRDREEQGTSKDLVIQGEIIPPRVGLYGPLRSLDPKSLNSLWQLIEQLTPSIPLNEYDLPVFVYRPDMLDYRMIAETLGNASVQAPTTAGYSGSALTAADVQAMLEAAIVPLSYDEGFPVLPSGVPFWNQLEYEHKEAYDAFVQYLEIGGARQLSQLVAYNLDELKEYFHLNYWAVRVKAFDLYRVAHHQKVKLQRMLSTEDSHYKIAEKLIARVTTALEDMDFSSEELSPEKAVNMLEKLVKVQRVSVGLPANGESKESYGTNRTVAPVNVIMQQISQGGSGVKKTENDVDLLLEDPDAVDLAQELIIKMQDRGNNT
jgi:hypothetical protein